MQSSQMCSSLISQGQARRLAVPGDYIGDEYIGDDYISDDCVGDDFIG